MATTKKPTTNTETETPKPRRMNIKLSEAFSRKTREQVRKAAPHVRLSEVETMIAQAIEEKINVAGWITARLKKHFADVGLDLGGES